MIYALNGTAFNFVLLQRLWPSFLWFWFGDFLEVASARFLMLCPPKICVTWSSIRGASDITKERLTLLADTIAAPYMRFVQFNLVVERMVYAYVGSGRAIYAFHNLFKVRPMPAIAFSNV